MNLKEVRVPDIGDAEAVEVLEIFVGIGDVVQAGDSLCSLESEKASMEISTDFSGTLKAMKVAAGDKVGSGSLVALIESDEASQDSIPEPETSEPKPTDEPRTQPSAREPDTSVTASAPHREPEEARRRPPLVPLVANAGTRMAHASPSIRKFARELGVDLTAIKGTGRKARISREDVQNYVKTSLARKTEGSAGSLLPEMPDIDFSKFGQVEIRPLSRIGKISAKSLQRSWLHVPHVTQFDEADITEMEAFRRSQNQENKASGLKLTPLTFMIKAVVAGLKQYPKFNSSLDPTGENLIIKNYYHIGIAVDTADGLVVPVVRNAESKSLFDLTRELAELSSRAREGKLRTADIQGAGFTISSLGGIGGTAFTPIVNAPEVAILGISRTAMKPVWQDGAFQPRLMLPLSLSYDHRVIDGADAARFTTYLSRVLSDIRRLLL